MSLVCQPVLLEVLAYIPVDFTQCSYCERLLDAAEVGASVHQEIKAAYPPEIVEQAERLAAWLQELSAQYGDRLHIRVVDPQSATGFFKSLRYWIHQYPAFVVNRRKKVTGWNPADVERLLADEVSSSGGKR
jgi:hypothetical protein